ncbi:MAG: ABC transporter transmembrane domain-containing protein [Anaerolineaceae bacterium]|jgi:ATP-binding cassette subfamily B protein
MFQFVKKHWRVLALCIIVSILTALSAIAVQFVKGTLLDEALARNTTLAWRNGLYLFILIAVEISGYYAYDRLRGKFVAVSLETLRSQWMASILRRSVPEFQRHPQGALLSTYTNKVESLKMLYFYNVPSVFEITFKALLVSISLLLLDYRIALLTLFLTTTPLYVPKLVEKQLQNSQERSAKTYEDHLTKVVDWLNGFEAIKNYSIERVIQNKFDVLGAQVTQAHLYNQKMMFLSQTISTCLSYFSHFIVMVTAGWLVLRGEFSAGQFFVAVSMIDQLSWPILALSRMMQDIVSVRPIQKEVEGFLAYQTPALAHSQPLLAARPDIDFSKVSYSFAEDKPLLRDLTFSLPHASKALLVGPNGSGKSTTVNLLLGYLEPQSGEVSLGGVPSGLISNIYDQVTLMRQEVFLFAGSLRENLSMFRDLPDAALIDVLRKVGLDKWADPLLLDMPILEGGKNVSGGEKRRIVLARSLLRQTPVLVLDEPFANLDEESILLVEKQINTIQDRTVLLISHQVRPEMLPSFNQVLQF